MNISGGTRERRATTTIAAKSIDLGALLYIYEILIFRVDNAINGGAPRAVFRLPRAYIYL